MKARKVRIANVQCQIWLVILFDPNRTSKVGNLKPSFIAKLELDFLSEGDYQATIYTDAEDVERNPNHLDRQVRKVTRKDIIELNLAKDGGALLHIRRL